MKTTLFRTFLILINVLCASNIYAGEIYKHIPFKLDMTAADVIIADYDLSAHRSIQCHTDTRHLLASFIYKGRDKTASLPVTLQNSRVPTKTGEELTDTSGNIKFAFNTSETSKRTSYKISCEYTN